MSMRLADLVRPVLDGVTRVVDLNRSGINIQRYLGLRSEVQYEHPADGLPGGERLGTGDLAVTFIAPHDHEGGDFADVVEVLNTLDEGARILVCFGDDLLHLPQPRLIAELTQAGCQILRVAALDYERLRTGVIAERVSRPRPTVGATGACVSPVVQEPSVGEADLRLANEYTLLDLEVRELRFRLDELEKAEPTVVVVDRAAEVATLNERLAGTAEELAAVTRRRDWLDRKLRDTQQQLADTKRDLARVRSSTSLRVGQAVVRSSHSPKSVVRLPVDVARALRRRPGTGGAPTAPANTEGESRPTTKRPGASVPPAALVPRDIFLRHASGAVLPGTQLSIAGVLTRDTAAVLGLECAITVLSPNGAVPALERARPDLVLIEAAATRPGNAWAGFADYSAVERQRQLNEVVKAAHTAGCLVVLWRNVPAGEAPCLDALAAQCDVVLADGVPRSDEVSWNLGVPLTALPWPTEAGRSLEPVHIESWDPRSPLAVREFIDEVNAQLQPLGLRRYLDKATLGAQQLPADLCRLEGVSRRKAARILERAKVCVGSPFQPVGPVPPARLAAQVASGARVIIGNSEADLGALSRHVVEVAEPAKAASVARDELDAPADAHRIRDALRVVFQHHSTWNRIGQLARLVGSEPLVADRRRVSVVASIDRPEDAAALSAAVLAQTWRPAEVVVIREPSTAAVPECFDELRDAGLTVRDVEQRLVETSAESPWVAPWKPGAYWSPDHLVDLLAGHEVSGAPVVALVTQGRGIADADVSGTLLASDRFCAEDLASDGHGLLSTWADQGEQVFVIPEIEGR